MVPFFFRENELYDLFHRRPNKIKINKCTKENDNIKINDSIN